MGKSLEYVPVRDRIAGKWQIPALIVAGALLLGAIAQIRSPRDRLPYDQSLVELETLLRGGLYATTLEYGEHLLERERKNDRDPRDLAPIHLFLGRAAFLQAQRERRETAVVAQRVIDAYDEATQGGVALEADDLRYLGTVYEWLGDFTAAVETYEAAIAAASPAPLEVRQRVLQLRAAKVKTSREDLHVLLDGFLEDARAEVRRLQWAADLKVNLLLDEERNDEARTFLEELRSAFEPSREREAFEYLLCLVDYRSGRFDDAERNLRALRNRLLVRGETFARSGWLLGRVVLNDGSAQRPDEALSFFRDVINASVSQRYTAASHLGMAEALAELHRWDEALEHYRVAVHALPTLEASHVLDADRVRASITVVGETLRRAGRFALAIQYLELATSLVDPEFIEQLSYYLEMLGETRASEARTLKANARLLAPDDENQARRAELNREARRLLMAAGDAFLRLAKINTLNERISSSATWRAADLFDEGGARSRTIDLLRDFVRERPEDPLTPQAWMRLGQSLHSLGRFQEAIEAYRACNDQFSRTLYADQSLIPLADCYMRLGSEYVQQAELTLRGIIEDWQRFTPDAPEFRNALFMLGDLLNRESRYEEAITILEEALQRYGDDGRAMRGLYLLADSYQLSALQLKEDVKKPAHMGEREHMRRDLNRRLERAAELFGQLVGRYEQEDESTLDEQNAMYLRYARLYQGDCLVELQQYGEALKIFERAAWIYKDMPSSLAAYVQIINCYLFLGKFDEGEAALRRAQYLVKTIPDEAFETGLVSDAREEWQRYFDWVETSGLLKPTRLVGR
jgi:tetratricopeptide (TPR) repeat protein